MSCGSVNGEADEGKKIVREVLEARDEHNRMAPLSDDGDEDSSQSGLVEVASEKEEIKAKGESGKVRRRKIKGGD
jgi:hypothetical protein